MGLFKQKSRDPEPNSPERDGEALPPAIQERVKVHAETERRLADTGEAVQKKIWREWKVLGGQSPGQIAADVERTHEEYPTLRAATEAWMREAEDRNLDPEQRTRYIAEQTAGLWIA